MAYQAIAKNGEIYHISPQYWQQNQQQQALLLRYFALPLKEDEHHLWLAVDSLNNLAALSYRSLFLPWALLEYPEHLDRKEILGLSSCSPEVNTK